MGRTSSQILHNSVPVPLSSLPSFSRKSSVFSSASVRPFSRPTPRREPRTEPRSRTERRASLSVAGMPLVTVSRRASAVAVRSGRSMGEGRLRARRRKGMVVGVMMRLMSTQAEKRGGGVSSSFSTDSTRPPTNGKKELTNVVPNDPDPHHGNLSCSFPLDPLSFTPQPLNRRAENLPHGRRDRARVPRPDGIPQLPVLRQPGEVFVQPQLGVRDLGRDFVQKPEEEVGRVGVERGGGGGAEEGEEVGEEGRGGFWVGVEEEEGEEFYGRVAEDCEGCEGVSGLRTADELEGGRAYRGCRILLGPRRILVQSRRRGWFRGRRVLLGIGSAGCKRRWGGSQLSFGPSLQCAWFPSFLKTQPPSTRSCNG